MSKKLNLRFREYVTGQLAVIVWWLAVCGFVVYCVMLVTSAEELGAGAMVEFFVAVISMLGLRIALETVSVLFEIAETLRELRNREQSKP